VGFLASLGAKLFELLLADLCAWASKKYTAWKAGKKLDEDLEKAGEHAKETKDTSNAEDVLRGNPRP
jgi:hypothetical protein